MNKLQREAARELRRRNWDTMRILSDEQIFSAYYDTQAYKSMELRVATDNLKQSWSAIFEVPGAMFFTFVIIAVFSSVVYAVWAVLW